jgi:hypothetical protein
MYLGINETIFYLTSISSLITTSSISKLMIAPCLKRVVGRSDCNGEIKRISISKLLIALSLKRVARCDSYGEIKRINQ